MRGARVLLIADDLTGAADACVAFAAHGLSGAVCFDTAERPAADATDVIAFSTDTRAETSSIAAARVRDVIARSLAERGRAAHVGAAEPGAAEPGTAEPGTIARSVVEPGAVARDVPDDAARGRPVWTFKKIDSTLRGNTGVEIRAALDATRARVAIVTPAFPALGRIVRQGTLRVEGRGAPPPIDVIARLALPQARPGCDVVAVPRGGLPAALAAALAAASATGGDRVLVCDAVDTDDLDAIVDAGFACGPEQLLWAGSAGLAHALARRMTAAADADVHASARVAPDSAARVPDDVAARGVAARGVASIESRRSSAPASRGPILLAIGSNHPATVAQQEQLLHGEPPVACLDLRDTPAIDRRLARGEDTLVLLPPSAAEADVARFAATLVARERPRVGSFIMSGGDTAARLCRHLQATRIDLRGEVSPGIPWGLLSVRSGGCWPIVLKSGGFGADDALQRACAFLRAHDARA